MTTMASHLPQHKWHQHHCHANDSWQQIQPAVYMIRPKIHNMFHVLPNEEKRGAATRKCKVFSANEYRKATSVMCFSCVCHCTQFRVLTGTTRRRRIIKQVHKNLISFLRGYSKIPFKKWYILFMGLM